MKMQVKMLRSKVSRRILILFVLFAPLPLAIVAEKTQEMSVRAFVG